MENVDQDAHTQQVRRKDGIWLGTCTAVLLPRVPSLFFFSISHSSIEIFFLLSLTSLRLFFWRSSSYWERDCTDTCGRNQIWHLTGANWNWDFFFFSTFNFQWHATSEEKKNKFFSRYLRRDRKWITFLSERKFSEKKKSRMPSGGSTLLLPSDQKSAKKKRESQSKKEKKKGKVNIWNKTRHCA